MKTDPDAIPSGVVRWLDTLIEPQTIAFPQAGFPERVPEHLFKNQDVVERELEEAKKKPKEPDTLPSRRRRKRRRRQPRSGAATRSTGSS